MSFTALCTYQTLDIYDLANIMAIERRVSARPWAASAMKDALMSAHIRVWGVREQESQHLLGFAVISMVADEAELLLLAVDASFQRQGLGYNLLTFCMQSIRTQHARQLFLEVGARNQAAYQLYCKLGFKLDYVRSNYYPPIQTSNATSSSEDALVMSLAL